MNIVAVTACPTGIAHSQMAAQNLENEAEARGHEIQVEVEGAMGTENELSDDRIAAADVVVIAADTTVHTDRFEGRPLVKGTVKDAVNRADELLDEAEREAGVDDGGAAGGEATEGDAEAERGAASSSEATGEAAGADPSDEREDRASEREDRDRTRHRQGLVGKLKSLFS